MIEKALRVSVIAAGAIGLAMAAPGTASASTASGGNTFGYYGCDGNISENDQYATWTCTYDDRECDDHGVYVGMRFVLQNDQDTGWVRATPNAGGCGHGKTDSGKWDTGWGSLGIRTVQTRLCRDDNNSPDHCYSGTQDYYR
jgi:hypothetical protein